VKLSKIGPRLASIVLLLSLILPLVSLTPGPTLAADPRPDPVHPLLARMMDENPDGMFRVIVMGNGKPDRLDSEVDRKGGKGKKSLPSIQGVAAELPTKAIRELAKHPDAKWVTIDAPMVPTVDASRLATDYPKAVNAPEVWNGDRKITGAGVTVAVLDSGINSGSADFIDPSTGNNRVVGRVKFNSNTTSGNDGYGHGTHVAGIIAANGSASRGRYIGIAPQVNLVNVKVSDDQGMSYVSDVINALQWVVLNRAAYNIRVVNLSLVSAVAESYLTSPLDAAVEMAWLSGIVVVVSAGNLGPDSMLYPPANDPLVITVGAVDTDGEEDIEDHTVPFWSSYGQTQNGFSKPEVVAPGRRIVSNLASKSAVLARQFPDRIVDYSYLRLSGTSMAAPIVSGIAALALQAHPKWTPDQLKDVLITTARPLDSAGDGAGEVDARAVVNKENPGSANRGVPLNLGVAATAGTLTYDSATWNSATWNSATWNSATWNSATWNSATWNSATWNSATWNSARPD